VKEGDQMTKQQLSVYESAESLKDILGKLKGRKFKLDCGHHVTLGHNLGNDIAIFNDNKEFKIICTQCSY
jgi:hypothetical protein